MSFSRWMQHRANARTNRKIRAGRGRMMGMDLLVLTTVGRRSGQRRESPLAWFPDGEDAWLVVASGGDGRDPDWFGNAMAHPDEVSIELPGTAAVAVAPQRLEGDEREQAWQRIVTAQPRLGKYQDKAGREYAVLRLAARG